MTLPAAARVYFWSLVGAAFGALVFWWHAVQDAALASIASGTSVADLVVVELLTLAVVAQHFPLLLVPRRKVDMSLAAHFALLLIAGMPAAVTLTAVGEGLGQCTLMLRRDPATGQRRRGWRGALFNTAQLVVSVALAGAIYGALSAPAPPLAVLAAAATLYLANSASVAVMAGLHQRKSPLAIWLTGRGWGTAQAAGLLALGVLAAQASQHNPWAPLAMVLPATLTHAALGRTVKAEAAIRLRDEFVSVAAHELRTPLTSLRGHTQLLVRRLESGRLSDPAQAQGSLRTVDTQAMKLCALVDQLLDASRLRAGKLSIERQPFDLTELARETAAALQQIVAHHTVALRADGPVLVEGDRLRLEQVLTNLIVNAAKHAPHGQRIEVEVQPEGSTARLSVRDYGEGIDPELRERIFERYYQAHSDGSGAGLGIGLYVAREIVRQH
ncbi:MAG: HAMP domain-containing histidine kinase, partial [Chloroflexi bacterium]|nr:HAMP domain-containing histidine kinase [Chloroflexota bacterium]